MFSTLILGRVLLFAAVHFVLIHVYTQAGVTVSKTTVVSRKVNLCFHPPSDSWPRALHP